MQIYFKIIQISEMKTVILVPIETLYLYDYMIIGDCTLRNKFNQTIETLMSGI